MDIILYVCCLVHAANSDHPLKPLDRIAKKLANFGRLRDEHLHQDRRIGKVVERRDLNPPQIQLRRVNFPYQILSKEIGKFRSLYYYFIYG